MRMTKLKFAGAAVAVLAVGALIAVAPSAAQQPGANEVGPPGAGGPDGAGPGFGRHGMHRGPWMAGPRGGGDMGMMPGRGGRMCDERLTRFAQWRLQRVEQTVKPTDAQRTAFDDFKAASMKAADIARTACPTEISLTPTGRLESAEKQAEARLQAIRTVRPALENFYKTLSDEQKARFNTLGPRSGPKWAGDWRERWQHEWHRFGQDQNRRSWRDRGSNDHGVWRRNGSLSGEDGTPQGGAKQDGQYDKSSVEGEERL